MGRGTAASAPTGSLGLPVRKLSLVLFHFAARHPRHTHYGEIEGAIRANLLNPLLQEVVVVYEETPTDGCKELRERLLSPPAMKWARAAVYVAQSLPKHSGAAKGNHSWHTKVRPHYFAGKKKARRRKT